jgi:hypothetical protein
MRKRIVTIGTLLTIAACGSASAATTPSPVRATVVGSEHGTLLLASPSGSVRAARGQLAIGTRVVLTNGRLVALGRIDHAVVHGVVVRRSGNATFLSAAKHVLVLHTTRTVASARDGRPAAGSVVDARVRIDDRGDLDEQNEDQVGNAREVEVQGVVTAVAAGSVSLTINGQTLTIPLPAEQTLPASIVGTRVALEVEFENEPAEPAVTTTTTTPVMTTTTVTTTTDRDGDDHHRGRDGGGDDGGHGHD